jgi:hypothetical protein
MKKGAVERNNKLPIKNKAINILSTGVKLRLRTVTSLIGCHRKSKEPKRISETNS